MRRRPSAFRQSDVTKTVKAVVAAGLRVVGVKVGNDGKIEVVTGEAPVQGSTPLDAWMTKHGPHQT
jgi:hypothetical protein